MTKNSGVERKSVAQYPLAGGRGGHVVEVLECKHAVVLARTVAARNTTGLRKCILCRKEEDRPKLSPKAIRELIAAAGGRDALLEVLVRHEQEYRQKVKSLEKARAAKLAHVSEAPPPARVSEG